ETLTTISRRLGNVANGQMIRRQSIDERPLVDEVENGGSYECSQDLSYHVRCHLVPGEPACSSQAQCHSRIEVGTTNRSCNVDTKHHCKTPSEDDDRPDIRTYTKEPKDCHTAVTEENEHHRAEELSDCFTPGTRKCHGPAHSLTCHRFLLHFCS